MKNKKSENSSNRRIYKTTAVILIFIMAAGLLTGCATRSEQAWKLAEEDFAGGDFEDAILQLDKVIDNAEADNPDDMSHMLEAYYLKGDCYKKLGDETSAAKAYQQAINADVANPDVERTATDYLRLGLAYVGVEDYSSAITAFKDGLAMDEIACEKELMHNLIVCCEKIGDWETAKSLVGTYVEKYPEDTDMQREYQFLKTR